MTIYQLLLVILLLVGVANCVTFKNVTVLLTSRWTKLYVDGKPAVRNIIIENNNSLGDYVNLQPLEIVKIVNQYVPILEKNSVSNLHNVMDVAITSCRVQNIQPGAFKNVPKLDYINLTNNDLEEIKNGIFNGLNLVSLSLQNNKISRLGDQAFSNMILGFLYLDNNRISSWNSNWFTGTPVKNIYLNHNLLEELPANAFKFFHQLNRNDFRVHFNYLVLNNNKLKRIDPKAFHGLEEFTYLGLQNNSLEELPPDLFHTVRFINTLELSDNKITNVDEVLKNTVVSYLRLHNNKLSCFPVEVYNVTKIYHLSMDGNPVTCDCVRVFEKWQQEAEERIVYLDKARKTCIH